MQLSIRAAGARLTVLALGARLGASLAAASDGWWWAYGRHAFARSTFTHRPTHEGGRCDVRAALFGERRRGSRRRGMRHMDMSHTQAHSALHRACACKAIACTSGKFRALPSHFHLDTMTTCRVDSVVRQQVSVLWARPPVPCSVWVGPQLAPLAPL